MEEDYFDDEYFSDTAICHWCGYSYCTCCGCDCWMEDLQEDDGE